MKRMLLFLILALSIVYPRLSQAEKLNAEDLELMARHFKLFHVISTDPLRYIYADVGAHIHVNVVEDGRSVVDWESTTLGSRVVELNVVDLEGTGNREIVVATSRGRVIAWDAETYDLLGENYIETFTSISCMTLTQLDSDPQMEMILLADSSVPGSTPSAQLSIYDMKSRALEWRSQETYQATEMLVANVDDDPQLEIILNTGPVIDSRFYYVEVSKAIVGGYGIRLKLIDLNGDGYPEIVGETPGFPLRVYDIYAQREVW